MESKEKVSGSEVRKKKSFIIKLARVFAWVLGSALFLIILVLLLIQVPAIQNFGRKKVVSYLENKLHTRVQIGKLDIKFPTTLSLQDVFFEDQSHDTLLFGGEIKVNIKMLRLLKNDIQIEEISLDNMLVKVKRLPPDSVFNFQFIADAFGSENEKVSETQDTSTLKMNIDHIQVKDTRIVYKDAYSGNDMDLSIGLFTTKIDKFDPAHLLFDIPNITLKGLKGHFYQLEPLEKSIEKTVAESAAQPENFLQLINKEIKLSEINVVYKNEPSHLNTAFVIGDLTLHPKTLDLKNSILTLKDATLNNSDITIETASQKTDEVSKDTVITVAETPSFKILSEAITINNSAINFDDQSAPRSPNGMDYSHLHLSGLSLMANDVFYGEDSIRVKIKSAQLKDQSGFVLNKMTADFEMNPTGVSLENLLIETPGSKIQKAAYISYTSLESIAKNPGALGLDIDLENSKLMVKDILTFVPALEAQISSLPPTSILHVDARITGQVDKMNFQKLILKGLSSTDINVKGIINGLPDANKLYTNLDIKKFQTSRRDILSLLPKNTLPSNITLPENLSASGVIKGGMNNLYTDLTMNSSLGGAKISGTLANITDKKKAQYDLDIKARNLQLKTILQNPKLGPLTADISIKGKGFDPKTANATFNGTVGQATFNDYNYQNIKANGNIANTKYTINASIQDPNADATIEARGEFAGDFPALHLIATIDSIKTLPLHLTTDKIIYHGKINGDFTNTDPNNLAGNLMITNSILVNKEERITLDSLNLVATGEGSNRSLSLNAGFISANIKGQYTLTQLGDVFQQAIDPYFSITEKKNEVKVDPYHFSINLKAVKNAALVAFVPELKEMKPISLDGNFASDSGWNINLKSPHLEYGTLLIDDANFTAGTKDGALHFKTLINKFKSGTSVVVYTTSLDGALKDNTLDFNLKIKDKQSADKYLLSGQLAQPSLHHYRFSIKPDDLLLNYEKWVANAGNSIDYFNNGLLAHDFILSQGTQSLSINSTSSEINSPLKIDFANFKISTLTGFVQDDSLMANGILNGNALVKNINTQPTFTTDLTVKDLSIYNDTIGNLQVKVNNSIANTYHADLKLDGQGNNVSITGDYLVKPENSSFDFIADIGALQMKAVEGFTKGAIKDARGNLYGKVAVKGNLEKPIIDGKIQFNNTAFNVSMLNNVFKVDKEAIAIISNEGIKLNTFTIRDTANRALVIDGDINTKNFMDYVFDMTMKANNFQVINSTKKDNRLFYGKMVFSTKLNIKGTPALPVIDGELTVNEATDFTVVLPQDEPGIAEREGVVRFVDYSAITEDSLFMAPYDSMNVSPLAGYDVSLNIKVDKKATFNLIVDEGNGDFLKLKGNAQLTGGIDASGKVTLTGSYEIEEGSYDLSFNFIKRKFLIQKGSRIVWTGEPTAAQIDITAKYIANTAPLDLVQGQVVGNPNIYKQKLPFEVNLNMEGELLKPVITFDIVLPEEKNYNVSNDIISTVQSKLTQMRQDPSEMNKQVFALLLLNRFVGENPFDNSSGGSMDANTFARQSVSKLLTEQLNSLAAGLVEGVDINFDLATTEDYTTGSKQDRTDFNVGISKRLLNDRLTVTVGSNFELEGPQKANKQQNNLAGNISINYRLSKDGRYSLRAYRKNDYTGALEGYIIETGVGFIINVDYNKFREIFTSKEQRKKNRNIRMKNKAIDQREKNENENREEKENPGSQNALPPSNANENE